MKKEAPISHPEWPHHEVPWPDRFRQLNLRSLRNFILGSLTYDKYGFEMSTVIIGVMVLLSVFIMLFFVTVRKLFSFLYNSEECKSFLDESDKIYFNTHYGTH